MKILDINWKSGQNKSEKIHLTKICLNKLVFIINTMMMLNRILLDIIRIAI